MFLVVVNFKDWRLHDVPSDEVRKITTGNGVAVRHNVKLEPRRYAFFVAEKVFGFSLVFADVFEFEVGHEKNSVGNFSIFQLFNLFSDGVYV